MTRRSGHVAALLRPLRNIARVGMSAAVLTALLPAMPAAAHRAEMKAAAGLPPATLLLATPQPSPSAPLTDRATRNGRDIYADFRDGLADPVCTDTDNGPLQRHFANAPRQLASRDSDVLPLFGYVVAELREASLPTEYALIPFVESGFKPGARSASGPAGLWQFIALTARAHDVPMRSGYDGRLSAVDSTRAAVRYLKTLHGMFAGDWRLAVMAYNAGEYRVFGALKRSGQRADNAEPDKLVGMPDISRAYVRKLHALACVLDRADDREEWMDSLDRPVLELTATTLPAGTERLDHWASGQGFDPERIKRLNPALGDGRVTTAIQGVSVLAPRLAGAADGATSTANETAAGTATARLFSKVADVLLPAAAAAPNVDAAAPSAPRTHVVTVGDSVWRIARRYGIRDADVLARNGLSRDSVLRPGKVLVIDAAP